MTKKENQNLKQENSNLKSVAAKKWNWETVDTQWVNIFIRWQAKVSHWNTTSKPYIEMRRITSRRNKTLTTLPFRNCTKNKRTRIRYLKVVLSHN